MNDSSPSSEISPVELREKLDSGQDLTLIDVREDFEREACHIGGIHIPLGDLLGRIGEIPRDQEVVIYCRSGARSARAVEVLRQQYGFTNLLNLAGGIIRWAEEVDPSLEWD